LCNCEHKAFVSRARRQFGRAGGTLPARRLRMRTALPLWASHETMQTQFRAIRMRSADAATASTATIRCRHPRLCRIDCPFCRATILKNSDRIRSSARKKLVKNLNSSFALSRETVQKASLNPAKVVIYRLLLIRKSLAKWQCPIVFADENIPDVLAWTTWIKLLKIVHSPPSQPPVPPLLWCRQDCLPRVAHQPKGRCHHAVCVSRIVSYQVASIS